MVIRSHYALIHPQIQSIVGMLKGVGARGFPLPCSGSMRINELVCPYNNNNRNRSCSCVLYLRFHLSPVFEGMVMGAHAYEPQRAHKLLYRTHVTYPATRTACPYVCTWGWLLRPFSFQTHSKVNEFYGYADKKNKNKKTKTNHDAF